MPPEPEVVRPDGAATRSPLVYQLVFLVPQAPGSQFLFDVALESYFADRSSSRCPIRDEALRRTGFAGLVGSERDLEETVVEEERLMEFCHSVESEKKSRHDKLVDLTRRQHLGRRVLYRRRHQRNEYRAAWRAFIAPPISSVVASTASAPVSDWASDAPLRGSLTEVKLAERPADGPLPIKKVPSPSSDGSLPKEEPPPGLA